MSPGDVRRGWMGMSGRTLRRSVAVALALLLAAALTVLYQRSYPVLEHHAQLDAALTQLRQANAQWSVHILRAQTGLTPNYDPVNAAAQAVREARAAVATALDAAALPGREGALLRLDRALAAKSESAERIKSERAVMVNSLRFLPQQLAELEADAARQQQGVAFHQGLARLGTELLRLASVPDAARLDRLQAAVAALKPAAGLDEKLDLIALHAEMAVRHRHVAYAAAQHALAATVEAALDAIESQRAAASRARLEEADRSRNHLFALAIVLCLGAGYAALGWLGSFHALRRAHASLAEQLEQTRFLAEQTAELTDVATRDPLTGLVNRSLLHDRLQHAIVRSQRSRTPIAVIFIDLDGFKAVNDRHGHEVGDKLLVAVAERLAANVRESDTAARLGGDEFVLLLDDAPEIGARRVAQAVLADIEAIRAVDGVPVSISASLGVCIWQGSATQANQAMIAQVLLDRADRAMYQAKGGGKGRCCVAKDATEDSSGGSSGLKTA